MVPNLKKITYSTALKLFSAAMLSTMLAGCSFFMPYKPPITQGTVINHEALNTLQSGLTMGQVKQILGPPMGQDPFYPRHWEYVFYTTDKTFDPHAVHHLIVKFDNDMYLDSWKVVDKKVKVD